MSGRNPAPHCAIDEGFLDYDRALPDTEVWRYARRLAASAEQQRCRSRRSARIARAVRRSMLLLGAALAGMTGAMYVGGSGALPVDPGAWRQAIAQTGLWDRLRAPAPLDLVVGAALASTAGSAPRGRAWSAPALLADVTLTSTARTAPATALRLPAAPVPLGGATLTTASRAAPAAATPRAVAPAAAGVAYTLGRPPQAGIAPARATPPYRVQLALLRDPRHAEPVWRRFVRALGPRAAELERFVETTRTAHGLRHLVQAGPLADARAAEGVCERVIAAGGDCLLVPPPS